MIKKLEFNNKLIKLFNSNPKIIELLKYNKLILLNINNFSIIEKLFIFNKLSSSK